jgi:hypothetical protein
MSRLVIKNHEGDEITYASAVVLLALVLPSNLLILTYWSMLLAGALHSGVPQIPALGFWSTACAVALFQVLGWKNGPITLKTPKR